MLHRRQSRFDIFAEINDSDICFTISLNKFSNKRIFFFQSCFIYLEWLNLKLVEDDNSGRTAAKRFYELQPVFGIVILCASTTVQYNQVKASLGQEELVSSMLNLLTAKIPDVQSDPFFSHFYFPMCD